VLSCAGSLYGSAAALAAVRSDNAAATQAYVRASEEYAHGASAEVGAAAAAIEVRASGIAGACPSALSYAPRDGAFGEIGQEVSTTLFDADVASMSEIRLGFARAIDRLRWSNRRITRLVRGQATEEVALLALAQPDVCADIEAWKATAYAALPQSASGFLARAEAIESEGYAGASEESSERVIKRLLVPYEGASERRTMTQVGRSEEHTDRMLGAAEEAARAKLAAALGVSAL
jgi:hypothetical protein